MEKVVCWPDFESLAGLVVVSKRKERVVFVSDEPLSLEDLVAAGGGGHRVFVEWEEDRETLTHLSQRSSKLAGGYQIGRDSNGVVLSQIHGMDEQG